MPRVQLWIHAVWGTKWRHPFLDSENREKVICHILKNARHKNIYIDSIGGYTDHLHCLISLGTEQTIAKVINLIKGESSHWINKERIINTHFEWADEYYAATVSPDRVNKVRNYINNQETHHRNKSCQKEYEDFD